MSKTNVLAFFKDCTDNPDLIERFNDMSLLELVLHAKSTGYMFSSDDLTSLVGAMEVHMIMQKMGEEIDAYSSLWPMMWGKPRLQYVVDDLYNALSAEELTQLIA